MPITTSIAVTSPLPNEVRNIINPNYAFSDDRRAGNYYRLLSENRLLWGRGINALRSLNYDVLRLNTIQDIKTVFPSLGDIGGIGLLDFDFIWSREIAYSKSRMPYVKRIIPRTYALTGFGGHGLNTAPAVAKVLAEHFLVHTIDFRCLGRSHCRGTALSLGL